MIRNYRLLVKNYVPIDAIKHDSVTQVLAIEVNALFMYIQQTAQEAFVLCRSMTQNRLPDPDDNHRVLRICVF